MNNQFQKRRVNHFIEIIARAFSECEIDDAMIDDLLNKYGNQITKKDIKIYLRDTNRKNMYGKITSIYNKIHKIPKIKLDDETIVKLVNMFEKIQIPFEKHSRSKSFPNYNYILYKLLELQDRHEILPHLTLLNDIKLKIYDDIFSKICEELNWKFIPTNDTRLIQY